jgi:bifunctional enzyme CysN/CysC
MTARGEQRPLRIVIVGHVDHGKSTLIGRLLYDTGSLPDGKREEIEAASKNRGTETLEWSFLLDSFQAERDQAVTIDSTRIRFSTKARDYVIIDAPGHREFLKNMVSGAAAADAAILVVDAAEGIKEQTRRHAHILSLIGIKQVAIAVNKMDAVKFDPGRFGALAGEADSLLQGIGITPLHVVPVSARHGDMIAEAGANMKWYKGKPLTGVLDDFKMPPPADALPLRFPVQDVYRQGETRIIAGRVESGLLRTGDTLLFSPGNEKAVVRSIEVWPPDKNKTRARAGECVGITIDEKLFIERGHIASHDGKNEPPALSNVFRARIFWLAAEPLRVGDIYTAHIGTHEAAVTVQSVDRIAEAQDLSWSDKSGEVARNAVAEITLRGRELLPLDSYAGNPQTGRVVLYKGHDIAGGGTIGIEGYPDQRRNAPKSQNIQAVRHLTSQDERARRNSHKGGIFWLTGLSGAGKSTLAMRVEKALFDRGMNAYVLDGDNIRHGLCSDLGFSPEDRMENIRRVGEVAALMADAGLVAITAFISPYRADRDRARRAAPDRFHEIYVRADLATCEKRDPKGLYKKARRGEIADFTGIGSPYEPPENPDLIVDTQAGDIEACLKQVVDYIERHMTAPAERSRRREDR